MGGGFADRSAGQHPDLTAINTRVAVTEDSDPAEPALRTVVLILLAVDGVLSAVAAALLLPTYLGDVPLPVSPLIAGAVNMALVWAAMQWTTSNRLAALPLWAWLCTVVALTFGGPGDDIIFGTGGITAYGLPLLVVVGALPPAWLLWRRGRR